MDIIVERIDIESIKEYLKQFDKKTTKIYLGCDSARFRIDGIYYADYCLVVVVHKNGCNGCEIFGEIQRERDYDNKIQKPKIRLMNEVMKITQFYLDNKELFDEWDTLIHLDINPKHEAGSSCVVNEAIGYVKGTTNITPQIKDQAFAASYAADRWKEIKHLKYASIEEN